MQFEWTTETDHHTSTGRRYVLRSPSLAKGAMSPLCADDRLAVCSHEGGRTYEARFWIGYDSIKAVAGTAAKAMRLLENELGRRALELFGVDDISFRVSA